MSARKGAPCARCGHGQKTHIHGKAECMIGVAGGGPCTCLSYLPKEAS